MTIDFYYHICSPPCKSVLYTAKALNIDLNLIIVDLLKNEHLNPEFVKINPQHIVPTIVDDGFVLAESRAIVTYLVNKYGKGSSLYPEEPKARALVDHRLYFDIGTLYVRFADVMYPQMREAKPADPEKLAKFEETLEMLDTFLDGQKYSAGPNLTVADFCLIASVSNFEIVDYDIKKFANIKRWYETVAIETPGFQEIHKKSMESVKFIKQQMSKNALAK